MISKIIGTLVSAVIGGYVFQTVKDGITKSIEITNQTSGYIILFNNIPFFNGYIFALIVLIGGLAIHVSEYNNYMEKGEDIVKTENNPKPHKQTYAEYVKERLMIEEMMR